MSVATAQHSVVQAQKDVASIHQKLSDKSRKEADITGRIGRITGDLNGRLSASSIQSKMRDLERAQKELSDIQREKSKLHDELARKSDDLHRRQMALAHEEERERKRVDDLDKRQHRERLQRERELRREFETTKIAVAAHDANIPYTTGISSVTKEYDFFISHASEDKNEFVRPLVQELETRGCRVWYDEQQLSVGDSLRRKIDHGISRSRFGVVVLSDKFFAKEWPQRELDGLTAIEVGGQKVILPIWHHVTKDEVAARSPTLADKVALNSSLKTVKEIAEELASLL
jgi:hypothetical protein